MSKIRLLDQEIANKIAAGEVIERPFSVVKELVENALDSGADRITVDIIDGGVTSIVTCDNGCGIDPDDAALAFLRHATSKLASADDLFNILTLGFRGEALASIAAVSKMEMITRTNDRECGVKINIEGGQIISNGPVGCPQGTAVKVLDLFYNTPARKKFLKGAAAETGMISDLVARLALSRPDVSFKLTSQNKTLLETPGNGKLLESIVAVYGLQIAKQMLPVNLETKNVKINGYVSKPELNRATRMSQTVLVNGRYVKSKVISNALQQAYFTFIPSNRHPMVVLFINISPSMVDVNVHPTKMEIRLVQEKEITEHIISAVHKTLRSIMVVPSIENNINNRERNVIPIYPNQLDKNNNVEKSVNKNEQIKLVLSTIDGQDGDNQRIIENIIYQSERNPNLIIENNTALNALNENTMDYNNPVEIDFPELMPLGQLMPTYILAQGTKGLYIIDQHAAHERVLYEQYVKSLDNEHGGQVLLVPVLLELSYSESQLLTENIMIFRRLGFIIEHFGENTFLLRAVPVGFPPGNETKFFYDLLDTNNADFFDILAARLACHNAIKAGQKLTNSEMQTLIYQMANTNNPYTCPHGRPTMIQMSFEELTKRFKR